MELTINKREAGKKGLNNKIRREGNVPAVIYSSGKENETVEVDGREFDKVLRELKQGHLPTTVFKLKDENGNVVEAIVKGIEYHPTTYRVLHLDFLRLEADKPINVKVPIQCVGGAECPGVKLGGVLRQVIRHLPVRCLPKDMPSHLNVDVSDLGMQQSQRLEKIKLPETLRPLVSLRDVVAVIGKR